MANRTISDLVRTMASYFRIGTFRLKDASGTLEVRNGVDDAYAPASASQINIQGATSGAVGLKAADVAGAVTYTLPAADGSSGEALTTDAAGNLSWAPLATASGELKSHTEPIASGDGAGPVAIVTPPASAVIVKVIVDVDTAFDATTPSLSVGIAGTVSQYMAATDVDLATVGTYEVQPMFQEDAEPDAIIATWAPGTGGTAGAAFVTVQYANPIND